MKKVNLSKTLVMLVIVTIICCISTINFAGTVDLNQLPNGNNTSDIPRIDELNNTTNNTATNNATVNNTTNVIGNTNRVGNTTNTTGTLPKTGVDDTIMWVLIGASVIAAIYTYKKVRDYNV